MTKNKEPRLVVATIEGFTKDGFGCGRVERADAPAIEVEVPFSMPGDQVEAALLRKRKGCYQAHMTSLLVQSPERIAARCKHFGVCGGCRWQHLSYEQQLIHKQQTVVQALGSLLTSETVVFPILACDPPWHYRNKMEFSFSSNAAGERFLGLMMIGGHQRVLSLTECHLVLPWHIEALEATRSWWQGSGLASYHAHKDTGSLRTLTLREGVHTGDRLAMLTVSGNPDYALGRHQLDGWMSAMQGTVMPSQPDSHLSLFLRIQQIAKGTPTSFYEMLLSGPDHIREILHLSDRSEPLWCKVSPSAFFQPNTRQAERFYSRALQMAGLQPHMVVYDLFCGTGTLGLAAAGHVQKVIGIEIAHESILDARSNAVRNGITNIEFLHGDVAKVLPELAKREGAKKADLVIVDPPRVGLGEKAIAHLLSIGAEQLLYVSCNPRTQAVDIADLVGKGGYKIVSVQPVDQFPHTVHLENIVLLRRSL